MLLIRTCKSHNVVAKKMDTQPRRPSMRQENNGVLLPDNILAFNLVSPLSAHFLQGPPSPTTGRRKRVSFDLGAGRDSFQRRSSILSAIQKSRSTLLRYMEIQRVNVS